MKSISKLLLFLEDFFEIGMTIAKRDVLQTVLMHFLVLLSLYSFPVFDYFSIQFSASSTEYSILGNATLKFLKLMFNFFAFSLLLIKFGLEFAGHTVVAVLGFFEVKPNLMNICKSVKIFVLI